MNLRSRCRQSLTLAVRLLLLCAVVAPLIVGGSRGRATTLTPEQQQLQRILAQRSYWDARLKRAQAHEHQLEGRLATTEAALDTKRQALAQEQQRAAAQRAQLLQALQADEAQVSNLQSQLATTRANYVRVHREAAGLLRRLRQLKRIIHQQLGNVRVAVVQLYDISRVSPLQQVLEARTLTDFLRQQSLVAQIGDRDTAILTQARAEHAAVLRVATVYINKMHELRALAAQERTQLALVVLATRHEDLLLLQAQQITAHRQASIRNQEASIQALAAQEQLQLQQVAVSAQTAAGQIAADQKAAENLAAVIAAQTGTLPTVGGPPGMLQWPLAGVITQGFGPSAYAFEPPVEYGGVYYPHFHTGLDIAGPYETPIHAAAAGKVIYADYAIPGAPHLSYGLCVIIMHTPHLATLYAHLDNVLGLTVKSGDVVAAGQVIGYEGVTGNTTGPHLHFEVRVDGQFENPLQFLPQAQG